MKFLPYILILTMTNCSTKPKNSRGSAIAINYSFDNDSLSLYNLQKCIEVDSNYVAAYAEMKECENRLNNRRK
jgi:hypothetical protein